MDINKATAEQLESAFQVDGTRARYLVERRTNSGPFRSWDEVKQVPGFEDRMVKNLQRAGLTIGDGSRAETSSGSGDHGGRHHSHAGDEHEAGQSGRSESRRRGLDINTATAEELEAVFQMDGTRARYLVDARNRLGGFRSWEQVKQEVPSFEDGMIHNLKQAGARIGQA